MSEPPEQIPLPALIVKVKGDFLAAEKLGHASEDRKTREDRRNREPVERKPYTGEKRREPRNVA